MMHKVILLALGISLLAHDARGAPRKRTRAECAGAFQAGRELRRDGHLIEAARLLLKCVRPSCGAALSKRCRALHERLELDIPTVVPSVTGPDGEPLVDVAVTMDGAALAGKIDGRAVAVDPGWHLFSFSVPGGPPLTERVRILEAQRNRPVVVTVSPPQR
jgi:hypothetical protein